MQSFQHGDRRVRLAASAVGWSCLLQLACAPAIGGDQTVTAELVASGLSRPLYVTHAPGDAQRLFVVQQGGRIRIIDVSGPTPVVLTTPFLDIQARVVDTGIEQGLLGMAFHPDFQNNGFFYVNYTGAGGATRVARFFVPSGSPNKADESTELALLIIPQPQDNHNGGWIEFGPDGLLYIATGDGGNSADNGPGHTSGIGNAQDITDNLLGKILRIDVDGTNGPGGNYGIPPDNPFVGVTGDDEIWSYGLRNPWRNSFDPITGDLYIADVGQADWEELDFQPGDSIGGENWGWRCREGAHDFNLTANCTTATLIDPIHEYSHFGTTFGCSITGGEVYRGCAMPALHGVYFFGDFCSNQVWSLRYENGTIVGFTERTAELAATGASINNISSFGRDANGELYICSLSGNVFKIVPFGVPSQCNVEVPAASTWALVWLTLLLTAAATWAIRRRAIHGRATTGPRS